MPAHGNPRKVNVTVSEVVLFTPKRFSDHRGWFTETYNADRETANGIVDVFVQDNQSYSREKGTIRGIHFQALPHPQAKLVRCARGRIIDYAVDLRRKSPTYGHYVSAELSAENGRQLYIPIGVGHAFITLEPDTEVAYKVSDFYSPSCDSGIRWDCPDVGIEWPFPRASVTVSEKDAALPHLADFKSPFEYNGQPLRLTTVD